MNVSFLNIYSTITSHHAGSKLSQIRQQIVPPVIANIVNTIFSSSSPVLLVGLTCVHLCQLIRVTQIICYHFISVLFDTPFLNFQWVKTHKCHIVEMSPVISKALLFTRYCCVTNQEIIIIIITIIIIIITIIIKQNVKLFSPVNITVQCDALENRLLVVENGGLEHDYPRNSAAILDALFVSWADFDVIAQQSLCPWQRTCLSSFRGKNNLPTLGRKEKQKITE